MENKNELVSIFGQEKYDELKSAIDMIKKSDIKCDKWYVYFGKQCFGPIGYIDHPYNTKKDALECLKKHMDLDIDLIICVKTSISNNVIVGFCHYVNKKVYVYYFTLTNTVPHKLKLIRQEII